MIDVNDTLPAVTVVDSGGNPVNLAALPTPFVLYFYPKADTPGCTKEGQEFSALHDAFARAGCAVYGMSKDKPAKLARFAAKYDLAVKLLSDEAGEAIEQMGVWVEKSLYGRNYMGIERATFLVGKEGKVAKIWRKVKVSNHAQDVLLAVQELVCN